MTGIVERLRERINDAPMPTEHLLDEAADTIEGLLAALKPFAELATGEVADCKPDDTIFVLLDGRKRYAAISMRDLRNAKAEIAKAKAS